MTRVSEVPINATLATCATRPTRTPGSRYAYHCPTGDPRRDGCFCTPGLLVAAHDLLRWSPDPQDGEIRGALASSLCRCTGYEKILDAVWSAARQARLVQAGDSRG